MPLTAVNFITKGPVLHADLLQFYNLFTGVMLDQPVTFKNVLTLGGNQGASTVPLKIYGAVGQTGHLLDLYTDTNQAQPGFGFGAAGNFGWGPGGASPVDTFLSRVATQNGHATDTAGLLIQPYLEVAGPIQGTSFQFSNGTALSSTSPLQLTINQDLVVNRNISAGGTMSLTTASSGFYVRDSVSNTMMLAFTSNGGYIDYRLINATLQWRILNVAATTALITVDNSGNLVSAGNITVSSPSAYIGNSAGASASPYLLERVRIYNDGANWAYYSYGADAIARFNLGSTAAKQMDWGYSTAPNNSGTFTVAMSLTGAGVLSVASTISGYNLNLSTGVYCANGNVSLGTAGTGLYVQTNVGSQAAIIGAGDAFINYYGSNNGIRFMAYNSAVIGALYTSGQLTIWDSIWVNQARTASKGYIQLQASQAAYDAQIVAESNILYLWCPTGTSSYVAVQGIGGGTGWRTVNALSFGVQSALKDKRNVVTLDGALDLVQNPALRSIRYNNAFSGDAMIGFVADEWVDSVPEIVGRDNEGEILAMDYARVGAITFQALKEYISKTDARIAELEARLAA